jgi:Mrp family chromosome partitioning ATPase
VAWIRADRDRRVHSSINVGDIITAPQLGEVALRPASAVPSLWSASAAPAPDYALVVAGMQARVDRGVVLVSSATPGEGRSLTALHLAAGAARDGRRVLLVDADPSSSELSNRLGLGHKKSGFVAVSSGQVSLYEATYVVDLGQDSQMWAVPAGATVDGSSTAHSGDLARILVTMKSEYDLVVIDGDAGLNSPQMAAIARNCDGVVMVVRRGTHTEDLRRLAGRLDLFGARQVGFVLVGADSRPSADVPRGPGGASRDITAIIPRFTDNPTA